jgi:hypothetical protein
MALPFFFVNWQPYFIWFFEPHVHVFSKRMNWSKQTSTHHFQTQSLGSSANFVEAPVILFRRHRHGGLGALETLGALGHRSYHFCWFSWDKTLN